MNTRLPRSIKNLLFGGVAMVVVAGCVQYPDGTVAFLPPVPPVVVTGGAAYNYGWGGGYYRPYYTGYGWRNYGYYNRPYWGGGNWYGGGYYRGNYYRGGGVYYRGGGGYYHGNGGGYYRGGGYYHR